MVVKKGEDLLQVVLLREKGKSLRLVSTCCHSTLMLYNPAYNSIMFMLLKKLAGFSGMIYGYLLMKQDLAESRIFVKDIEASRGKLLEFNGDPDLINQTCWPPYVDNWKSLTSPNLEHPKGETCQSLFMKVPKIILGLEEGNRILKPSNC